MSSFVENMHVRISCRICARYSKHMFYVWDSTVGASHLVPFQPATLAPVPATKDIRINTLTVFNTSKTTTTQRPATKPNLAVTKTSPSITTVTTAARDQTTLSAHTPPSGPGNVYT